MDEQLGTYAMYIFSAAAIFIFAVIQRNKETYRKALLSNTLKWCSCLPLIILIVLILLDIYRTGIEPLATSALVLLGLAGFVLSMYLIKINSRDATLMLAIFFFLESIELAHLAFTTAPSDITGIERFVNQGLVATIVVLPLLLLSYYLMLAWRKSSGQETTTKQMISIVIAGIAMLVSVIGISLWNERIPGSLPTNTASSRSSDSTNLLVSSSSVLTFEPIAAVNVPYVEEKIDISPDLSRNFSVKEIQNLRSMETAYGVTFTPEDLKKLEANKFIVKNLLDTNLGKSVNVQDTGRELVALYSKITGEYDYKTRTQANSLFISSDAMFNLFSILSVELLRETENKYLYPSMLGMTHALYDDASAKLLKATDPQERNEWTKVREYFAVPYALLSTAQEPPSAESYWNSGSRDYEKWLTDNKTKDGNADSYDNAVSFVKKLSLDTASEANVIADLKRIYDSSGSDVPSIFQEEYEKIPGDIELKVPFSLFKPRGTYTSLSVRRQYFRAIQWYQQIPFFLSSKDLTSYARDIGVLMNNDQNATNAFRSLSSLIGYLVGQSDDLDVGDYAKAASELGEDRSHDIDVLTKYLLSMKPAPMIKAMPASYPSVGNVTVEDALAATRGMRFISQKFVPDSYWTGKLTQGDEAPAVGGEKLPDMASSLEVMSILGSPYATDHLPNLDFYSGYKTAINTRLGELKAEKESWGDGYWPKNLYTSTLWTISGLFGWLESNRAHLPEFMRSPLWGAKNLLTASGFWTELRHTSILYAKQSFAEKGGGGDGECDKRQVPEPPKGYIEPDPVAYDRLSYMAKRLSAEYKARQYDLQNLSQLGNYISLLDIIREYTKLELENTAIKEPLIDKPNDSFGKDCIEHFISPDAKVERGNFYSAPSRWEEIRTRIVGRMQGALPRPVEGPVLPIKDKRMAVVADVHTGKEGQVLEEGTGVPRVIFVAVKDANGARLTVGFIYSQYEFVTSGDRLTDEEWQQRFYTDSGNDSITYKPKNTWPDTNTWYRELLGTK